MAKKSLQECVIETPPSSAPVLVIGSGYGGAVAARRLCEAGIPTLVVEMGRFWRQSSHGPDRPFCGMIVPDNRSFWFRRKTEVPLSFIGPHCSNDRPIFFPGPGALDYEEFPGMHIYVGRGVGGGSLVNGAMAPTPNPAYFDEMFNAEGNVVDRQEMYNVYYPRARKALWVNDIDRDWFKDAGCYKYAHIAGGHATNAGFALDFVPSTYSFAYMKEESELKKPQSALKSEVIYGNNFGKRSLDKTYLACAAATGNLKVLVLHKVLEVAPLPNGQFKVTVAPVDLHASERNGAETLGAPTFVTASSVFFAAGSVGTSKLLVAMKHQRILPNLSDAVGKGWGNNGNIMVGRKMDSLNGTVQSTMPALAIQNWNNPIPGTQKAFIEITPFAANLPTDIGLFLAITDNRNRGTFTYSGDKLILDLGTGGFMEPSKQAAKSVFAKMPDLKPRFDLFRNRSEFGEDFCYHPLGGCVIGKATDPFGRLLNYKSLYVIDGSLVPGGLGVNPFLTITALAERNIEHIIKTDFQKANFVVSADNPPPTLYPNFCSAKL